MPYDPCLIYPDTVFYPGTILYPWGLCVNPPIDYGPGGGGYGCVMGRRHFERYQVTGKWRGVERVRATPARRSRSTSRSR